MSRKDKFSLSREKLEEVLRYNEETGQFIWRKRLSTRCDTGKIAGAIHPEGYIIIGLNGFSYLAHRLAWLYMTGAWPEEQIDHINQDRTDNRWENLRGVTGYENHKNCKLFSNNTSGVTGVYYSNKTNKWISQIKANNKACYIGSYEDFFEACCARKSAERKHGFHVNHGKYN